MKKFFALCSMLYALCLASCDLQPKIASVPDSIGEFISSRYPAMLADPVAQPEIYNSAALDYGTYANASLYGNGSSADDYMQFASAEDYKEHRAESIERKAENTKSAGDDYLSVPSYSAPTAVGTPTAAGTPVAVKTSEITIAAGDTLYSLSRKYEIPVNDLAVMNNLSAPFAISIGQKLKIDESVLRNQEAVAPIPQTPAKPASTAVSVAVGTPAAAIAPEPLPAKPAATVSPAPKISSAPTAKLPAIAARTSAKFSWPVRGKILSGYGEKGGGLFNDGINIKASAGTAVGSAENGVVAYAGNELKGMGNLIIVQHADGWMTVYAHLDSMAVRRGAKVSVGQKIGQVGQTGKVSEPQLHFEIRKGTKAYDPAAQLKK